MSDKVKLKKVTPDNWEEEVELELGACQEDLVAGTSIRLPRRSSIPTRADYVIFGFVEVGRDRDGKMIAVLKL